MGIVTLVIAVLGLVIATCTFTWNVTMFRLQGARAKVTPIIGVVISQGLVHMPASDEAVESIKRTAREHGESLVAGVQITNRGRLPLHVKSWAFTSLPSKAAFSPGAIPELSPVPCEIAPGNYQILVADVAAARALLEVASSPQKIACKVMAGDDKTHVTPPLPQSLLT
ncbi:hypothetical protein BS297_25635 [Rhodococcus erythropolis]|uniref:Uncharacterized protein n=1 Tax=Rhodococcus erythropolis TaxID=1833 RepID=A0A5N5DYE2_RHOER|nr:hypothetical protein BS297_25635 [Rhodococcus erythropolis]